MSNSLLNIGASGLRVAERALQVTGHNIANAGTPGYSRQQAIQHSNLPLYAGVGYMGQGAHVTTVRRIFDGYLNSQVTSTQSQASGLERQAQLLGALDGVLSHSNTGLSVALQDFFAALDGVASNPSQLAPRQAFIAAGEALANRIRSVDQRLDAQANEVNQEVSAQVSAVNGAAKQIAALNERIRLAEAVSHGQPANDLRDQRDALVQDLNAIVRTRVVESGEGQFDLYIGNGQPLVLGQKAFGLKAEPSEFDASQFTISFDTGNGTMPLNVEQLGGGKLAGLLAFRQDSLEPARAQLGRIVAALGSAMNTQHAAGFDLSGAAGGALFTFNSAPAVQESARNTGAGSVNATLMNANDLTGHDYQLTFRNGEWLAQRMPDRVEAGSVTPPGTLTLAGLELAFAGVPDEGDTVMVRPTRDAARSFGMQLNDPRQFAAAATDPTAAGGGALDNGNANALAALRTAGLLNGGSTSISNAYIDLVAEIGTQARGVSLMAQVQGQVLKDSVAAQQSVSGVNLDEEAANLLRYQQAYQASAKVMQTASSIFDTLLSIAN